MQPGPSDPGAVTAVVACGIAEMRLLRDADQRVARSAGWIVVGRLAAIAAISAFGFVALLRIAEQVG